MSSHILKKDQKKNKKNRSSRVKSHDDKTENMIFKLQYDNRKRILKTQ